MSGKTKNTYDNQQTNYSSNNQDTRNELAFAQVPTWEGLEDYKSWTPQADPTIPYRAAASRRRVMNTYSNPTGAYATPELQTQRQLSALGEIDEQAGQQARQGAYDVNMQNMQKFGDIARLTAPVSYNARTFTIGSGQNQNYGSGSGTTQGPGFFSQIGSQVARGIGDLIGGGRRSFTG